VSSQKKPGLFLGDSGSVFANLVLSLHIEYIESNDTKGHDFDQSTTRSFWSDPGSPVWFPSVGQTNPPNPPTQSLWLLRWKEHNRHCWEDDCPLSLFSLSKIIMQNDKQVFGSLRRSVSNSWASASNNPIEFYSL